MQYEEDDGDNDQDVNPTADLREARKHAPTEKAEQPKYEQNYDDRPQHEISPFE
jgi:hypothetical protein